jgi:hypothetical protein
MMREAFSDGGAPEVDLAKIVYFDSFRAYKWLITIAEPNQKLYGYLRDNGVDIDHIINLTEGAIALCEWSMGSGPKEDCIFLPIMEDDGVTPLDVVMFSMREPSRFGTMLGLGAVLGAGELMNPATYWGGEPCRLLRTPLDWLREGIAGCAVVLDPLRAKPILDWTPGNLAAMDDHHADKLVDLRVVDPKRLLVPVRRAAA